MKHVLFFALLALGIAGCGGVTEDKTNSKKSNFSSQQFPAEANTVFGAWELTGSSGTADDRLYFNRRGEYGREMICDNGVGDVRASGTGSAGIGSNLITFQTATFGKVVDEKGNSICTFSSGIYSVGYVISNDKLVFTDGSNRIFSRLW